MTRTPRTVGSAANPRPHHRPENGVRSAQVRAAAARACLVGGQFGQRSSRSDAPPRGARRAESVAKVGAGQGLRPSGGHGIRSGHGPRPIGNWQKPTLLNRENRCARLRRFPSLGGGKATDDAAPRRAGTGGDRRIQRWLRPALIARRLRAEVPRWYSGQIEVVAAGGPDRDPRRGPGGATHKPGACSLGAVRPIIAGRRRRSWHAGRAKAHSARFAGPSRPAARITGHGPHRDHCLGSVARRGGLW